MTLVAPGLDPTDSAVAARLVRAFVAWDERLTELFAEQLAASTTAPDATGVELRATVTAGVAVAGTRAVVRLVRRHPDMPVRQRARLLLDAFAVIRAGCVPPATGAPASTAVPA